MEPPEGNKLIAEFMNIPKCGRCADCGAYQYSPAVIFHPKEMQYHSSWSWLMPCVEKISEDFDVSISSVGMWACYISRKDSDCDDSVADFGGYEPMILNVWNAVVKFLKWYNKQPKYNNQ